MFQFGFFRLLGFLKFLLLASVQMLVLRPELLVGVHRVFLMLVRGFRHFLAPDSLLDQPLITEIMPTRITWHDGTKKRPLAARGRCR